MVDNKLDLEFQELVFIGSLYEDQSQVKRYGGMLNTQGVFQTPIAASVWKKSWDYYSKYGALPETTDVADKIFTEDELEGLAGGIGMTREAQDRAGFLCDQFKHTLDLTFLKAVHHDIERIITNPRITSQDGAVILDTALDKLLGRIVKARISLDQAGVEVHTGGQVVDMWEQNEYPSQGSMFPVAIPGIMDSNGESKLKVPVGTVNVVVASYGAGKSSVLACMAVEYLRFGDVLYVTLEISENAIYFKMLAHISDGMVKPEWAFEKQTDLTDAQYALFDAARKDLGSYKKDEERPKDAAIHTVHMLDAPADGLKPNEIANHITRLMAEYQIEPKAVMVDYAALMRTNDNGNRSELGWQYVGTIITELSAIAKKNNLIIWTAAQIGGEQGHTDSIAVSETNKVKPEFRALGGKDLYGSKEALHNASLVFGLSVLRSADCPWIASGILSTWKNRYSESFNDWMVRLDYSKSRITVAEPLLAHDKADVIQKVIDDLKYFKADAEKDGRRRGLDVVVSKGSKGRTPAKAKPDPRIVKTQGHDETEYA